MRKSKTLEFLSAVVAGAWLVFAGAAPLSAQALERESDFGTEYYSGWYDDDYTNDWYYDAYDNNEDYDYWYGDADWYDDNSYYGGVYDNERDDDDWFYDAYDDNDDDGWDS